MSTSPVRRPDEHPETPEDGANLTSPLLAETIVDPKTSRNPGRWLLLLAVSLLFAIPLELLHLPAALLLGPMAAAITIALKAGPLQVPKPLFAVAQAFIGCMMARAITADILTTMHADWPLFLGMILLVLVASSTLGWLLTRWQVLPGTTAIWGSSPGAASAMVILADAYGADARLVAFMQYLRVVFVAVAASVVARIWTGASGVTPPAIDLLPPVNWEAFGGTIALVAFGLIASRVLKLSGGSMLIPLLAGAALNVMDLITIELPPLLLVVCYALLGWSIGLRFTPSILHHALKALPRVAASTLFLMALCGCLAATLVHYAGIDPLTAYLATSPGGADSVAIIAASSDVDVPFVMAMQTGRFLVILFTGPMLARFLAKRTGRTEA